MITLFCLIVTSLEKSKNLWRPFHIAFEYEMSTIFESHKLLLLNLLQNILACILLQQLHSELIFVGRSDRNRENFAPSQWKRSLKKGSVELFVAWINCIFMRSGIDVEKCNWMQFINAAKSYRELFFQILISLTWSENELERKWVQVLKETFLQHYHKPL